MRAVGISVRKPTWYGLTTVEQDMDLHTARKAAGLDWNPMLAPLSNAHTGVEVDSHQAVYRTDNKHNIGVVRSSYELISNDDYFDFIAGLGEVTGGIETMGSIHNGAKVFTTFRVDSWAPKGDSDNPVQDLMSVVTSHDGSVSLRILPRSLRIVCANTFTLAVSASQGDFGNDYTIKHTTMWKDRATDVRRKYVELVAAQQEARLVADVLSTRPIRLDEAERYFYDALPPLTDKSTETIVAQRDAEVKALVEMMEGPTGSGGTWWSAAQSVVEWYDWLRPRQPRDGDRRRERRINRTIAGFDADKDRAVEIALGRSGVLV